jgi:hypothetical protein
MGFFRFAFSFLYVRNWQNGQMQLSRARVTIFMGGMFLMILALGIIYFLQTPVVYVAT